MRRYLARRAAAMGRGATADECSFEAYILDQFPENAAEAGSARAAAFLATARAAAAKRGADLSDLEPFGNRLQQSTPLWFYVLREADLIADGAHLGPVGGRIVAEVLIGLMRADSGSWLNTMPDWQPTLPMADPAAGFRMTDLLRFAGVDPESRRAA